MSGEIPVCAMTSGDIARLLDVDLKTIHNWVRSGYLHGRRTEGRHLRFLRTEVVRFMRTFGYRVPETIARPVPKIVLVGLSADEEDALIRGLTCAVFAERSEGLFHAALVVAAGDYEVLVVCLEGHSDRIVGDLLKALRSRPTTQGLATIGVSQHPEVREAFLRSGGDVALESAQELAGTVKWLIGAPISDWGNRRRPTSRPWKPAVSGQTLLEHGLTGADQLARV